MNDGRGKYSFNFITSLLYIHWLLLSRNWEYIHVNEGTRIKSKELKMMIYYVLSFTRANTDALK